MVETSVKYSVTTKSKLDLINETARAFKGAFLSGDQVTANTALSKLYDNTYFKHLVSKYKKSDLDLDDYIQTIFSDVFLNEDMMRYWDDTRYSFIGFLRTISQTNGHLGVKEKQQSSLVRPSYIKNHKRIYNDTISLNASAKSSSASADRDFETTVTLQDTLSTQSIEDELFQDGTLDEDSKVVHILKKTCSLTVFDTRFLLIVENEKDADAILSEVQDLCKELCPDEICETINDVERIHRRIRKRINRGDKSKAYSELSNLHYVEKEAV